MAGGRSNALRHRGYTSRLEAAMARFTAQVLGLSACLTALISFTPAYAEPFFVTVYGRTYKVNLRFPPNEPYASKPKEALKALPADIAGGPDFRPSHEQVLAEVEERTWIARNQFDDELAASSVPPE